MRAFLLSCAATIGLATHAAADQRFEATLAGHAILPAFTMALPLVDAPRDRFTFPFFTIENVAMVDADHVIVSNDNNLPFSAGRHVVRADANEFILLRVPELLRAR